MKYLFYFFSIVAATAATRTVSVNDNYLLVGTGTNLFATNFPGRNIVLLDENGSDTEGSVKNRRAYKTAYAASIAASNNRPSTIVVQPGWYGGTNNLAVSNVNWYLYPGATLAVTNVAVLTNTGTCRSLFDDLGNAVKFTVGGYGDLFYYGGIALFDDATDSALPLNNTIKGPIYTQNSNSSINIQCRYIDTYCMSDEGAVTYAVWCNNATNITITCDDIRDLGLNTTVQIGVDEFDDPVTVSSSVSGPYWELGNMYLNCNSINVNWYPLYFSQPAGSTHSNEFWGTFNVLSTGSSATGIYLSGAGTSTNWKSWITVDDVKGGLSAYSGGPVSGIHYLTAKKLGGGTPIFVGGNNGGSFYLYADVQKIHATAKGILVENSGTGQSFVQLKFHDIINKGGMTHGIHVISGTLNYSGHHIDNGSVAKLLCGASGIIYGSLTKKYVVYPTLTVGSYTNQGWENTVVIPVNGLRTNYLVNATNFPDHEVTVVAGGINGTGVTARTYGELINGGIFSTNVGTNFASMTFKSTGTNWIIKSRASN